MANLTWNKVTIKKELAEKFISENDEGKFFDFNKIIPMPKELDIDFSLSGEEGLMFLYIQSTDELKKSKINKAFRRLNMYSDDIYKDPKFKKIKNNFEDYKKDVKFKKSIQIGKKYLKNYEKFGHCNWYSWCECNWGTKWNSDDCEIEYNNEIDQYEISFTTAWSRPYGIIEEVAKLCDDGDFYWLYQDEFEDETHLLEKENGELIDTIIESNNDYDYEEDEEVIYEKN